MIRQQFDNMFILCFLYALITQYHHLIYIYLSYIKCITCLPTSKFHLDPSFIHTKNMTLMEISNMYAVA